MSWNACDQEERKSGKVMDDCREDEDDEEDGDEDKDKDKVDGSSLSSYVVLKVKAQQVSTQINRHIIQHSHN